MQPFHVVIVGGGTAGWLSAGMIASKNPDVQVTLVESPEVKNLGVGEGTWPTMRETLRQIGISELAFLKHCKASFKQASKFVGWQHGGNARRGSARKPMPEISAQHYYIGMCIHELVQKYRKKKIEIDE